MPILFVPVLGFPDHRKREWIAQEYVPPEKPRPSNKVLELLTTPLDLDDGDNSLFAGGQTDFSSESLVKAGAVVGAATTLRRSLFEDLDDVEEFEEDLWDGDDKELQLQMINVLGYKVSPRGSLSGRRGALKTGLVMITMTEVEGTAMNLVDNALSSLEGAEDRRLVTLRALALLVQELLQPEGVKVEAAVSTARLHKVQEKYTEASFQLLGKLQGDKGDFYLTLFEDLNPEVTQLTDRGARGGNPSYLFDGLLKSAMLLWSTSRRLTNEALALLPMDLCLPVGDNDLARCRVAAFFTLRKLYRGLLSSPRAPDAMLQSLTGGWVES